MAEVSEFDVMRQRIRERELQRGKQASEQVKGQFASRGLLASGGQIKAQQQSQRDVSRQAGEERRDVLIAEAQTRRAEREAEAQRTFQRGERIGGQEFAAGQAGEQRKFLTGERLGTQAFTTSERGALQTFQEKMEAGRQDFTTAEREAAQKFAGDEAADQRTFLADESKLARDLSAYLSKEQIDATSRENLADRQLRQELADAGFDQADQDRAVAISQFNQTLKQQQEVMAQNKEQFDQELEVSKSATRVNAWTALKTAGMSDGEIRNLLIAVGLPLDYFAGQSASTYSGADVDNSRTPGGSGRTYQQ
ncbi:hypothetical protein N8Z24_00685 [bacterium]|nr:hypothetical protein [bacterium]